MTEPRIVGDPAAVSAEWLTEVLQHAGYDMTVTGFEAANVGTGQVGQNVRFNLTQRSGEGPSSIVGKFASADPVSRATGIEQGNYASEVHFYRELRTRTAVQTPQVLFTQIEPSTSEFCLIMEDLHPAQQGDQIDGCSVEQARLAVQQAAALHGPTWNQPFLDKDAMIARNVEDPGGQLEGAWSMFCPAFIERYREHLEPRHLGLLDRFGALARRYGEGLSDVAALTHGDFRLDNMMFGGPYPLAVVDWQTPRAGHPVADVSYFIGAGLKTEQRRAHEEALVREYIDALSEHGVTYPFDACWTAYRFHAFSGLLMAVFASMIVGQTDRGDAMFMAMATRHADQAIDLDSEALLA